jgi:hypothetical protein
MTGERYSKGLTPSVEIRVHQKLKLEASSSLPQMVQVHD